VGLACKLFWEDKRDPRTNDCVEFILAQAKAEPVQYMHPKADLYTWYYHSQAMLFAGGGAWQKWEPQFREMAVRSQSEDGSWPVMQNPGHGNFQTDPSTAGAVYRTTLNVLMLETYYRYLPTNQATLTPGASLALR
jgi:hypothetical protein